jgi:hypothetical protein
MEDLLKEIATLKNGIQALNLVIENYKSAAEILSIKLEEFEIRKIDISNQKIVEVIEEFFETELSYTRELSWSDRGFTADFELEVHDMLSDEMGHCWKENLADAITTYIQDTNK